MNQSIFQIKFRTSTKLIFAASLLLTNLGYADNILSKSDAAQMFLMPLSDWKENVSEAKRLGYALPSVDDGEREYTLVVKTPHGRLITTPEYSQSDFSKPQKLVVSVIQTSNLAKMMRELSDAELKQMIAGWHREMLPEYTVISKIELSAIRNIITYNIFQRGSNPIIDKVGDEFQGCWKNCIQRD
jgi:hypothetical protein